MNTPRGRKQSFTLIEMLAVIAIIGVLIGIVFRLSTMVATKTARANTAARLERLKMCLEEYYRVFGEYPPGGYGMGFESEYVVNYPDPAEWGNIWRQAREDDPHFNEYGSTGLVYYLWLIEDGYLGSDNKHFLDPPFERWREYAGEHGQYIGLHTWWAGHDAEVSGWYNTEYSNMTYSLKDTWERQFVYECDPPYQSYRLYSLGPDGEESADDIGRDQWTE